MSIDSMSEEEMFNLLCNLLHQRYDLYRTRQLTHLQWRQESSPFLDQFPKHTVWTTFLDFS